MIGGVLGRHGIIPGPGSSFFVTIIVKVPVVQIVNILNGLFTLALEWTIPFLQGTAPHRSFVFRSVFYVWCAFTAMLVYQSVDGGVYYLITAWAYLQATKRKEVMEGSDRRGKVTMA